MTDRRNALTVLSPRPWGGSRRAHMSTRYDGRVFLSRLGVALPLLALTSHAALAGEPTAPLRVAVIPGVAVNLDTARVDALTGELAEALTAALVVEARGGLEVRRLLPADGLPPDCVATPACTADVARRTGATQLLFVVIVDAGGVIQVDTTWVEPATGASAARPALDLTSAADARPRFTTAARDLLPDATPRAALGLTADPRPVAAAGPRHLTTPAMITGAAAVVGLGIGIGVGLSARSRFRACEADPASCTEGERDGISSRALIADLGYLTALGAGIATAVLYVTSGNNTGVVVTPGAEGVSVSAVGRF